MNNIGFFANSLVWSIALAILIVEIIRIVITVIKIKRKDNKGYWIEVSKDELLSDEYSDLPWYKCSECGEVQLVIIPRECKFCRKCGADMRGDINADND